MSLPRQSAPYQPGKRDREPDVPLGRQSSSQTTPAGTASIAIPDHDANRPLQPSPGPEESDPGLKGRSKRHPHISPKARRPICKLRLRESTVGANMSSLRDSNLHSTFSHLRTSIEYILTDRDGRTASSRTESPSPTRPYASPHRIACPAVHGAIYAAPSAPRAPRAIGTTGRYAHVATVGWPTSMCACPAAASRSASGAARL